MRTLAMAAIATVVCGMAPASAADVALRAVRHHREVVVSEKERLAATLVALVESCSVDSTVYAVYADTWAQVTASDSFVHVVFAAPRRARLQRRDNRGQAQGTVREILLPLPEGKLPDHVFVRTERDTVSLTKYDPRVLREVVAEQDLRLQAVEPYKSLLGLPSP